MGREAESARLDRLVDGVLVGAGGSLVLSGAAGVGKTVLLDVVAERAARRGAKVLIARGVESEAQLAFSTLGDLVTPLLGRVAELPPVQGAALLGALALGPSRAGDRFAVCVATWGLLLAHAATRPVVLLVDDVQWVDASSLQCLGYAARRASKRPLGIVLTSRESGGVPVTDDLPQLTIGPLEPSAARALLSRIAPDLERPVVDRVLEAAGGLPLALVELAAGLGPEQRCRLPPRVPLPPGPLLTEVYLRRIRALSGPSRTLLLVAAAYEGDDLRTVAAAAGSVGCGLDDLTAAEEAGLVGIEGGRLTFTHPLVRGATYHGARGRSRRAAHAALAGVVTGEGRTWHRAAAAVEPEEEVAAELEHVARSALVRRAPADASTAFERSARLTPERSAATRRLVAAGETAVTAGQPERALSLLEEAVAGTDDRSLRASARHLQGLTLLWRRGVGPAVEMLVTEATRIQLDDPCSAAVMLADASLALNTAADTHEALEVAERAAALLGGSGTATARAHVFAALGWALLLRGQAARAQQVLARVDRLTRADDPLGPTGDHVKGWLYGGVVTGAFEATVAHTSAMCADARRAGALGALPNLLVVVADCAYRMGDWAGADRALTEAQHVGRDTGQAVPGHAAVIAARLAGARGQSEECRAMLGAVVDGATASGMRSGLHYARAGLGFLELGLARAGAAVQHLEWVSAAAEHDGMVEPTLIPWAPDLVEAYLRMGRARDARRAAHRLVERADTAGTAVAAAAASRCRGMVHADYDEPFLQALRLDDDRPMPFERARTQLAYGRRLHRAKRRVQAREHLHEAVSGFERLGARPWAAQAAAELRAAGGRRTREPTEQLTEQERRVVAAVQRGGSNRDIAAELFLSPKTVEFHLGKIYRKLGVSSRTQLVASDRPDQVEQVEPPAVGG